MIAVTRLDGTPMVVNSDQIAWIEYNPDTVISLMNGEKLIVRESPEAIVDRVKAFRRDVFGRRAPRSPVGVAGREGSTSW
jgi:flagellar protein FlbD